MTNKIRHAYEKMMVMTGDTTRHFKLYKSGKIWVIAGLATVSFALAPQAVQAATTAEPATQAVTADATDPANSTASSQSTASSAASSVSSAASSSVASAAQATSQVATETVSDAATSSASAANTEKATQAVASAATSDAMAATSSSTTVSVQSAATSAVTTAQNATSSAATISSSAATSGSVTAASTTSSTATSTVVTSAGSSARVATPASAATSSAMAVTALPATATQADITAAKAQASTAYQATGQAQMVTAASDEPTSQSTASIVASTDKIGYGSGLSSFTLTVTMNVQKGDVVTYTLPTTPTAQFINGVFSLSNIQDFQSAETGTMSKVTNADGTITVTDTINATGSYTQLVTLGLQNNYAGQIIYQGAKYAGQTLLAVGDTTYTVTVNVNGEPSGSTHFTQVITPTADVTAPTQTHPNSSVTGLLPDTDYVWEVSANEANGILDDYYRAARVNQVVNYGTTITIPTPTGFVLNQTLTDQLNAFGNDQTTITQLGGAGDDVVITVPKGSGSQYYYGDPAYRIAGHFDTTQAATDTTLTATGPVVMVQHLNDQGDTQTWTSQNSWTVNLLGTDSTPQVGVITVANGNNLLNGAAANSGATANPKQLLLNADQTNAAGTMLQFKYEYDAAAATTEAAVTLTVPDGMAVNQISVPKGGADRDNYMPDTTTYTYVLTLAGGATETGTVTAGGTVTSTGNIRTAVFTPDYLAAGAASGNFNLIGTLAATYDDGTAVKIGDQLTGTIAISVNGGTTGTPASFMQTVVAPIAAVSVNDNYSHTETGPGKGQGSTLVIWGAQGAIGQNSYSVYEPIFYYVVPSAFIVDRVVNAQNAKVTTGTDDNGNTVVKVDFTGTGESVDVTPFNYSSKLALMLHNADDAMVGSYHLYAYVTSPTTALVQTDQVTDLSQTMGDGAAVKVGDVTWKIDTVSGTYAYGLAQGDDASASKAATIDKNSTNPMNFYDTVMNVSATDVDGITSVVNLPEIGDDQGSTYTFNLTGPITLPEQLTTQTGATVALTGASIVYSTSRADLTSETPDITGYLTADQVTDWNAIRSVALTFDSLPAGTTTGRIILNGTVADMPEQAGKIGYIATAFYMNDQLSDTAEQAASIAITGNSTIYARAHYVDATGADQYVYFTDLDKTLTDHQDTLTNDYPTTQADLSAADQALLPVGYDLQADSLHLVDGQANGAAVFDQVVTNAFDGDYAQYELVATDVTVNVAYVDEAGNTIATGTASYPDGNQRVGSAYATTQLAIKGYTFKEMAMGSLAASGTLANAGGTVTYVYRKDAPVVAQDTVTKTVHYQTSDGTSLAADYTIHADFTSSTDPVTDEVTYTPTDAVLGHQANPTIKGYHVLTSPAEATADQTVAFGDQNQTYTVVYEKDAPIIAQDTVTKTVHYQTSDGTSLAADYTAHADFTSSTDSVTDEVTYTPTDAVLGHQTNPTIKGYHVLTSPAEATADQTVAFGDQDQTYTVVYQKDGEVPDESQATTALTVHYVDQNGDTIAPDTTQSGTIGTDFTVTAPAISGYTLSDPSQRTTTGARIMGIK